MSNTDKYTIVLTETKGDTKTTIHKGEDYEEKDKAEKVVNVLNASEIPASGIRWEVEKKARG